MQGGFFVSAQNTYNTTNFGNTSIAGNLSQTGAGALTQTGGTTLAVTGTSGFANGAGNDITLANVGNDFGGAVTLTSANNVSLRDANALDLSGTVSGNLTTNAGTELITGLCKDPELMPEPEGIAKALREPLLKVFPPALLGRLVVIPYYPLTDEMIGAIASKSALPKATACPSLTMIQWSSSSPVVAPNLKAAAA